jgi:hypothetical protein
MIDCQFPSLSVHDSAVRTKYLYLKFIWKGNVNLSVFVYHVIIKTKVILPVAYVTLSVFVYHVIIKTKVILLGAYVTLSVFVYHDRQTLIKSHMTQGELP